MKQEEYFSSRWALIIATIGIAVGTGNIWRFSRIVAQNGGGSFLIPWVIFLLIWSVPLIIAEFAIGKSTRFGPVGAISKTAGKNFAWMGAFVVFVSTAIMFYYSVVTGWCLKYFLSSVTGEIFNTANYMDFWKNFSSGYQPLLFHLISMVVVSFIVYRGITKGIERVTKFLVPSLLIILLILFARAVTLPNSFEGIKYFFTPDLNKILDYKIWLNALTQNAWDTGAGWGLILTYAIYMRQKEDISLNAALIGFGNNSVSLIAGIIIFSTVFALSSNDAITQVSQSGPANTGLTFIYLPLLLLGIPSALSLDFFTNQDWVWGVGLILSGAFISFSIIKFGVDKFRTEIINGYGSDIKIGKWYNVVIGILIPLQVVILISWWLISSVSWDPEWWNPFHILNAGTIIFQWGIVLITFILLNRLMVKQIFK
ncbi:MAG: sodium-dependent transporter [Ignavibacteriaceae bacterium]